MSDQEWICSPEQRAGLLVAVISGGFGREKIAQRETAKLLKAFEDFGCQVVWCVVERDAPRYEQDEHEMVVYPMDWAVQYATDHWTDIQLPKDAILKGGLASAGRVWSMMEAERRGCWGVLQLDDNIRHLAFGRGTGAGIQFAHDNGGLAMFADILAGVTLSTNSRMTGAQLKSVAQERAVIARPGIPYSLFIERVGEGREDWYGPCEGDIIQAFQYSHRADGATTAIVPSLRYEKCGKVAGGFRSIYDHSRAVQLQRMFPAVAKIGVRKTFSNGRGGARVFHTMASGAVRNPLRVHDPELMAATKLRVETLLRQWHPTQLDANRAKVAQRVARGA
jgi:hypothetical protein